MLFEKMLEINVKHPIANLNKKEAKKSLSDASFPKWCVRQSDLPTYVCIEESKSFGYRPQIQEKFRKTNGHLKVSFEDSYWFCIPVLTEDYQKTEKGTKCNEDFATMTEKGNVYLNTSNFSSEKRHAIAVAKAASVLYDLAFSEIEDVDVVDLGTLQNTKRRNEVYKFYGRMRQDFNEEKKEEKPEEQTTEQQPPIEQVQQESAIIQVAETVIQTATSQEISMPQQEQANVTHGENVTEIGESMEDKKKRIEQALKDGTFNVDNLLKEITDKKTVGTV